MPNVRLEPSLNSGYILARMRLEIVLAPEAREDYEALSAYDRAIVRDAMEKHLRYEPTKTSRSRIKRLRGMRQPQYRLLVGEHRVFYDATDEAVEVLAIVPKSKAEQRLERFGEPALEKEESE
jgi:mRNA-degrading endonuclease RelE of RelBE toxin-antitoxin system